MGPVYRDPLAHASLYTPSGTRRNECLTRNSAGRLSVHPPLGGATTKAVLIGVQDVGALVRNRGVAGEVIDSGRCGAGRVVIADAHTRSRWNVVIANPRARASELIDAG